MPVGSVSPLAFRSSVRLLLCHEPSVTPMYSDPWNMLPPSLRDHVQPDAAGRHLGALRARREAVSAKRRLVAVVLDGAVAERRADQHAVDLHRRVQRARAVHAHVDLLHHLRAAHVRLAQPDALREIAERLRVARRRQRIEQVAGDHQRCGPPTARPPAATAPDTVTVSSRDPTWSCTLTVAVKSAGSSSPSRTSVLKPVSVNVIV